MSATVAVPKREPCQRCQLPVFLAERLLHDGRLYHRTCLRCARCRAQLTPGSFYETEADGEYCCETCPDEESAAPPLPPKGTMIGDNAADNGDVKKIDDADANQLSKTNDETAEKTTATTTASAAVLLRRQSFSHKLALFQARSSGIQLPTDDGHNPDAVGKGLLTKSLSDEEKSKSLKRLTALYSMHAGASSAESLVRASFVRRQLLADVVAGANGGKCGAHEVDEEDDEEEDDSDEGEDEDDDTVNRADNDNQGSSNPPPLPGVGPPEEPNQNQQLHHLCNITNPDATTEAIVCETTTTTPPAALPDQTADEGNEATTAISSNSSSIDLNKSQHDNDIDTAASVANQSPVTKEETVAVIPTPRKRVVAHKTPVDDFHAAVPSSDTNTDDVVGNVIKPVPRERSTRKATAENGNAIDAAAYSTQPIESSYPQEFNPFGDDEDAPNDDEEAVVVAKTGIMSNDQRRNSYNPFDSSDDEIELDKLATLKAGAATRVPLKATTTTTSMNPFGSEDDDDDDNELRKLASSNVKRTPVPTPRKVIPPTSASTTPSASASASMQTTPEPFRRASRSTANYPLFVGDSPLHRNSQLYGSASSLASTASALNAYTRRHKKRAPLPPTSHHQPMSSSLIVGAAVSSASLYGSIGPSPCGSGRSTPTSSMTTTLSATTGSAGSSSRKKRAAPKPPALPTVSSACSAAITFTSSPAGVQQPVTINVQNALENDLSPPAANTTPQLSPIPASPTTSNSPDNGSGSTTTTQSHHRRKLITLDASLLESATTTAAADIPNASTSTTNTESAAMAATAETVVYRRTIMPNRSNADDDDNDDDNYAKAPGAVNDDASPAAESHDRQWQKVKENKESLNKNRQSQLSTASSSPESASLCVLTTDDRRDRTPSPATTAALAKAKALPPPYSNKSTFGKWKRRKASAPLPPILASSSTSSIVMHDKKSANGGVGGVQMLPLTDIRYELEVIEVQQQGLEKQGIQLEKMIRERCEGGGPHQQHSMQVPAPTIEEMANTPNTKEVEDLILQLFEIVNEKNELFRRQAELMYLRRLHRLEQEQAEIEYDIRMLMEQPESNKTDSDKAREDSLIARKIEIVLQRNEVIDCLECDRLREAEEDESIKTRLDEHNARWDEELAAQLHVQPAKLSKKEKKKLRETKKLTKQKKMDADKDADESELKQAPTTEKKKKRKFLF